MGWFGWSNKSDKSGTNTKYTKDDNSQSSKSEVLKGTNESHSHTISKTTVDAKTMQYKTKMIGVGENAERTKNKKNK